MKKLMIFMYGLIALNIHATDLDTLKQRVINDLMVTVNSTQVSNVTPFITSMTTNGSWSDINYTSTAQTNWPPQTHLDRVKSMVCVYLKKGQSLYLSSSLSAKIDSCLTYWYSKNPTSTNWWYNDIGKQSALNVIGLLMKDHLRKDLLAKVINDLSAQPSMTAANLTDIATSVIYRGLIEGNLTRVNSGLTAISNEIKITTGEGLQIDWSFHQHGPLLYNGGYGFVFLSSATYWCEKVTGTTFAFLPSKITLLSNMLLFGNRWMTRGTTQDYAADGRGISRPNSSSSAACITYANRLAKADPSNSKELLLMVDKIQSKKSQNIMGNKHFWKSDFSVHHRNQFYTSVKMCSKRTKGIESGNSENLKGYWLPFGVNFIFRKGDEYSNIFPVWNWALLPGVTNPNVVMLPSGNVTQTETFVGGVTDNLYGVSAMAFNQASTTAKKAWFFFDKEWVALGTGISSTHTAEINTTINQTFLGTSAVLVNGNPVANGTYMYDSLNWVMNDSIAYIFLEKKPVTLTAKTQTGSWYDINNNYSKNVISKDIFTLYLRHGKSPVNQSYQYVVVPGLSSTEAANYYKDKPVTIIENTPLIQAVTHKKANVTGIVFYQPGTLKINDTLTVSVDQACEVILVFKGIDVFVKVANPKGESSNPAAVTFTVNEIWKGEGITVKGNTCSFTLPFPQGDSAGSSIGNSFIRKDCYGIINGSAIIDNCDVCSGGKTGIAPNSSCAKECIESIKVYNSGNDGNIAANTLDNNFNTRWSANGDAQWILYKFPCKRDLQGIKLAFYNGHLRSYKFDVLVSQDSIHWMTSLSNRISSGTTSSFESYGLSATNISYVKIIGHGNSQNTWNSINETKFDFSLKTDCNNKKGGNAFIDSCIVCAGGTTGIKPILDPHLCSTASVKEYKNEFVNVYPNPSSGTYMLNLENLSGPAIITIQSIEGKTILIKKILINQPNTLESIDISMASDGIYFLIFNSGNYGFITKISIQKYF
jgi:chondroitin AC lyase